MIKLVCIIFTAYFLIGCSSPTGTGNITVKPLVDTTKVVDPKIGTYVNITVKQGTCRSINLWSCLTDPQYKTICSDVCDSTLVCMDQLDLVSRSGDIIVKLLYDKDYGVTFLDKDGNGTYIVRVATSDTIISLRD